MSNVRSVTFALAKCAVYTYKWRMLSHWHHHIHATLTHASALCQQKVAGSPAVAFTSMHVTPSRSVSCRVSCNCIRPGCNSPPGAFAATALPRCCMDCECSLTQPSELPENSSSCVPCSGGWLSGVGGGETDHARHVTQARCA